MSEIGITTEGFEQLARKMGWPPRYAAKMRFALDCMQQRWAANDALCAHLRKRGYPGMGKMYNIR